MHGRIKTRTTAEQEKLKKLEREKKVEAYKKSMEMLTVMRKSGCYERDALDITSSILQKNPDILTVWNYRREIFLHMKNDVEKNEFQKLLEGDLSFTERCLQVNPKSYGSWHHREWVLCIMPEPNWDREMLICKRYLELDERNFHCWDYRRFVAKMSKVSDLSEYEYTLEKIKVNFSNYSAWHLRSKLLPKIFPDVGNNLPINETKHKEELKLVENAAFTDPNDQSAWFYQRWLLGLAEPKTHIVCVQAGGNQILVAVSKYLNQNSKTKCGAFLKVEINNEEVNGIWKSTSGNPHCSTWIFNLEFQLKETDEITLHLTENGFENDRVQFSGLKYIVKEPNFMANFSACLKEVLTDELSSCEQLLELEPDSKWTTLTKTLLMGAIDVVNYEKNIENGFKTLIEIDPLRSGYYHDLYSKFIIENEIRKFYTDNDLLQLSLPTFFLIDQNLTCLYHMQYLILLETVDLSFNALRSEALSSLHCLINCKRLNLDNNKIETLKFLPILPNLTHLSLWNNKIKDCTEYRNKCSNLQFIRL